MTALLVLGIIILSVLLHDTRKRLAVLEEAVRDGAVPFPWRSADETAPPPQPVMPTLWEASAAIEDGPAHDNEEPKALAVPVAEAFDDHRDASQGQPTYPDGYEDRIATAPAGLGFEDLFGRKLPIWAGGITLLVAAVLLVRYSIDAGLLSPAVRVALGFLFGLGLIGGAELARRREDLVQDTRVAQSLAGAGIGALYAATLAAANLYDLVRPGTAFAGLAGITASAILLAVRFGMPSALLGLVGGLAAPALVQSAEPNMPLMAAYVAILVGGLTLLSRRQRWAWLGISALIGGAGWSLVMILTGAFDSLSTLSVGLLVLLLGAGLPVLAAGQRGGAVLRYAAAIVAALQLALLVATGDFAPLTWGLYALLSVTFIWLSGRIPSLRISLIIPLFTALALLTLWPAPNGADFVIVVTGIALIYGGHALWCLRHRARMTDAVVLAATALAGYFATRWQFEVDDWTSASLALAFAVLPAAGTAITWLGAREQKSEPFALQAFVAALLIAVAAVPVFPEWSAPATLAILAAGVLFVALTASNQWLGRGALLLLGSAALALTVTGHAGIEFTRLIDAAAQAELAEAVLRWGVVASVCTGFAWWTQRKRAGTETQVGAVLLGYGLAAQMVPAPWLAVVVAAALLLVAETMRQEAAFTAMPAVATLGALAGLWAIAPLAQWMLAGLESLAGQPMLVTSLPEAGTAARQLLVPATLIGIALWRHDGPFAGSLRLFAASGLGTIGIVGAHILYKQTFMLRDAALFVSLGMAERTVWEALLVGSGVVLWKLSRGRLLAMACITAGLAHALFYTMLLHNSLWSQQAVGSWPFASLLLPAYGLVFAALMLIRRLAVKDMLWLPRLTDQIRMAAILLFACSALRQVFVGSMLAGTPVSAVENIAWSVLAAGLAIGFLLWGIRRGLRDWRIASLVLMLGAVGKVFLLDASGLEGLLRIASFIALGFSLIGIGWLYSRYLRPGSTTTGSGKEPKVALEGI